MHTASQSGRRPHRSAVQVFGVVGLILLAASSASAKDGPLSEKVLKAVKHATVQLRVKLANNRIAEGSGWFAVEKGLIITNAHVLGMVDADSRRPQEIEATIDSGEKASRSVKVTLLGVDRSSDLAVLRAEGDKLPAPLPLGKTNGLRETQPVYVFGFPFGKQLGKNITVSQSSISSLRKDNDELKQIQVNGGIHPGNSGGPVIDGSGKVVGVAVSAVSGTQINFAIPSDKVADFLAGRIHSITVELAYLEGAKTKVPVRLVMIDPLSRIKNVSLDYWVAPSAKSRIRPGGKTKPAPLPEDSPSKTVPVEYKGDGEAYLEVEVEPLTDAKMTYWFRPAYTDGAGDQLWHRSLGNLRPNPIDRVEATLKFAPKTGRGQQFELTDNSTFQIRAGAQKPQTIAMQLKVIMNPTVRAASADPLTRMDLAYTSFTIGLKVNNEPVKNSEQWRTIGQNVLKTTAMVEFETDGSVARTVADLKKASQDKQLGIPEITEHFLQSLDILCVPLPDGPIKPGTVLRTQRNLSIGLPGMFVPATAVLKYQYLGTRKVSGDKPTAYFEVTGTLRGRRGDGLNVGGGVKGKVEVSMETGQVVLAATDVKVDLEFNEEGAQPVRLSGTLALQIRPTGAVNLGPPVKPEEELEVGANLFAEREKKWLPAKILELKDDGKVRVSWDGHENEWDEDVVRTRLRFPLKQ